MTDTSAEVRNLTHLEFDIPCESNIHPFFGTEPGPAAWVLRLTSTARPCGCPRTSVVLLCDDCMKTTLAAPLRSCSACGTTYDMRRDIVSFERISR